MKTFLLTALISLSVSLSAQDETVKKLKDEAGRNIKKQEDTLNRKWRTGGFYNINIGQGTLKNWAAGGDDFSLNIFSALSSYAFYKEGKHSWDNTLDINLGYIKTTSLGSRKNDDRFDLLSKYGYALTSKLNASAIFNFRSQLFKGYTYDDDNERTFSSAFLSPAYLLLGVGVDWKPVDNLSIFVSPATSRWVIVKDDTLSAKGLYGVEPGKHVQNEFGAFASINYLKAFNKNVTYKGRLDLFSNYRRNPGNVDLYMTNILSAKIGKVIAFNWSVDLIYDDDVRIFGDDKTSPALQLKSLLGLGLQLTW